MKIFQYLLWFAFPAHQSLHLGHSALHQAPTVPALCLQLEQDGAVHLYAIWCRTQMSPDIPCPCSVRACTDQIQQEICCAGSKKLKQLKLNWRLFIVYLCSGNTYLLLGIVIRIKYACNSCEHLLFNKSVWLAKPNHQFIFPAFLIFLLMLIL